MPFYRWILLVLVIILTDVNSLPDTFIVFQAYYPMKRITVLHLVLIYRILWVDTGGGLDANLDFLGASSFISDYFRPSSESGHTAAVNFICILIILLLHNNGVYTHLTSLTRWHATGRE